jgi:putative ABC transport system permease protein
VVGILAPGASVLDRLILTSIDSVWLAHGIDPAEHALEEDHDEHEHEHAPAAAPGQPGGLEITALLLTYNSPLAAIQLPRTINQETALQAASPAFETVRLLGLIGVGLDTLRGFGLLLIATAGLSVFIALSNAMQERRYDLAVMRTLGASRRTLLLQPLLEGLILAGGGAVLGIALGHGVVELLGRTVPDLQAMGLTGADFRIEELYLLALAIGVGALAALLPAIQAWRTDIAATLAAH